MPPGNNRLWRYSVAIVSVAAAVILSLLFPSVVTQNPFLFFWVAVLLSALYGGFASAVLAAGLAVVSVVIFLMLPGGAVGSPEITRIGVFAALSLLVSALFERHRRTGQALTDSERQLQAILSSIADGVTAQTPTGQLAYANEAAARAIGYPSAAALQATPTSEIMQNFELFDEHGAPLPLTEMPGRLALQGKESAQRIVQFRNRTTGETRWSIVKATPILDEAGAVRLAINLFQDITDIKRGEQSLTQQREWFQVTLAAIGDGVIATDLESRITFLNSVAESLTGWSAAEALGKSIVDVFQIVNEQTRESVENPVMRVIASGTVVGLANHTVLIARDGSERAIDDSGAPIRDHNGNIIGAVLIFRDVSERRAAERELRETNQALQAIVDGAPLAIILLEPDDRVRLWSPAAEQMLGWSGSEMIGKPLAVVPSDQTDTYTMIRTAVDQGLRVVGQETRFQTQTGDLIDVAVSAAGLRDEDDQLTAVQLIAADITERKRAELAQRATHQQTLDILESISDAFYALDGEFRFTYVNRRAEEYWNRRRGDLIGRHIREEFPQIQGTDGYENLLRAFRDQQTLDFETYSRVQNRWLSVIAYPSPNGLSVYFRDVHERRQSENAQRFLQEASGVLNSSLDYQTTLANVARLATPRIADWCAVDVLTEDEEIQRLAVAHVDPDKVRWAYELQERFPRDENATQGVPQVIRTNQPEFYPRLDEEALIASVPTEEQAQLIREIGFRSAIVVPLAARGRTFGALTLVNTVDSERYFDERDLWMAEELGRRAGIAIDNARLYRDAQAERERLQVTLSSIGDAVIATDEGGHITFMNGVAQALTGWSDEAAFGKHLDAVFRIVNEESRRTVESPVTKVIREGQIVGLANHTLLIARDGQEIPIDDSGAPIWDEDRNLIGVVLVFRDITERKAVELERADLLRKEQEARATAEEANELKLKFLAMISHELRTPLTSIKGFTSTLLAGDVAWDVESQREFVAIMDEEADKLTDLVEQLLDVSRLQAGTLRINPRVQPFGEALNTALAQLYAITQDHVFQLDVPDDLPLVNIDSQRIAQVLVNLVDNAVKYSPQGSQITLKTDADAATLTVSVTDQGEGIAPEERGGVFEAFRQVDRQTGRQKGAGLGLAICKGLVEAHGGDIWIDDASPSGTVVAFTLPIQA